MKLFLVSSLIACSFALSAHASPAKDAERIQFCEKAYNYTRDKQACHEKMNTINYLAIEALEYCRKFTFETERTNCLDAISNREYRPTMIKVCSSRTFTQDKIECLQKNGYLRGSCQDPDHVSEQLASTIDQIDRGYVTDARRTLITLSEYMKTCH